MFRKCNMSLLQQFIDVSLVSRQRLMQAREFYSPSEGDGPGFCRGKNARPQKSGPLPPYSVARL